MANYGPDPNNPQPPQIPPQVPPQQMPPQQMPPMQPPMQQPMMGAPMAPPPRRRSPLLIIGIVVVALIVVCAIGFFAIFGIALTATQPVVDAGNTYMTALRDGDYAKAFSMSTQTLQQQVGDAQGLQTAIGDQQPATWSFDSRNVNNDLGDLTGTATYKSGKSGPLHIQFNKVGNDWKVSFIQLQ